MSSYTNGRAFALTSSFFEGLELTQADDVLAHARTMSLQTGAELFLQGDPPASLFMVTEGRLKVWKVTRSGTPLTVHHLEPGDLAGCVAVFCGAPYPGTAVAVEACRLLVWPAETAAALARRHPQLSANALRIVGARTARMLGRIEELSTEPADTRIARALLRAAAKAGADGVVRASRQDLAELTATTLYTVSRAVSAWEKRGWLDAGRGRITLTQPEPLRELLPEHEKAPLV